MPEKKTAAKAELHNRSRSLWQLVLLLSILVAATVALVVTCIYQFIPRSDYEISLFDGLISESQRTSSTSGTAEATAQAFTGAQVKAFDFSVSDNANVWGTSTTVELFQTSYKNDKGQITVQSADTGKVVAPGTGGSYTFSLKNASDLNSNYQVWLDADVNIGASGIPIEFRMSGTDGWTDGEGNWLSADELNEATARNNLYSGKSTEYTLYWRWAFERGQDEADTSYGNISTVKDNVSGGQMNVSQSVSYKVTLHTLAAEGLIGEDITPSPIPTVTAPADRNAHNTDRNPAHISGKDKSTDSTGHRGTNAKTGDTTPVRGWLIILCIAAVTITVAAALRSRKRRKQEDR